MLEGLREEVPGLALPGLKGKFFVDRSFENLDHRRFLSARFGL